MKLSYKFKTITALVAVMLLSGCTRDEDGIRNIPGNGKLCLRGVTYYKIGNSIAPAFNQDSTIIPCHKNGWIGG